MLRRITKAVFALMATLVALTMVAALSLAVWVMQGPKPLTKLLPYIEASLNPAGSPYKVTVDNAMVHWAGWREAVDFRLYGMAIYPAQHEAELLRLPEVSVGLDLAGLLQGRIKPESVILRSPEMRFFREDDGEFYVGIGSRSSQRVPLRMLAAGLQGQGGESNSSAATQGGLIGGIRYIAIDHARLTLGEPDAEALFDAQDANLHIRQDENSIHAELDIALQYDNKPARISGRVRIANQQDMVVAKIELLDVSPHMFARLAPAYPELAALHLPLSGWSDVAVDDTGKVTLVDFKLQAGEGRFTHSEHFAEPLDISQAQFEGQIRENFSQFILRQGKLRFGEASLSFNGIATRHEQGWTADAAARAENMPTNDLYKYWPKSIATSAYSWVTTHIREGVVPHAEARVRLTADDLGKPFPASGLDVHIEAEGVQVEYLAGHPKVQDVKGVVKFTGEGMTITSQQGKMLGGGVLKDARLEIPQLAAHRAPMHIKLAVEAPAADVARYLSIPELDYAAPLGLSADTIKGKASATMQFDFLLPDADSDDDDPQLKFLIAAEITGGEQPGFMGDMNLSGANGKLNITQDTLEYNGTMAISNAPLNVALTHYFDDREYPTEYRATGALAIAQLQAFGVPELSFMVGDVALDAHIRRTPKGLHHVTATADMTRTRAALPEIGLYKQEGSKAQLRFEAHTGAGELRVPAFDVSGEGLRLRGNAHVREQMSKLHSLQLEQVEFGDNNLSLMVNAEQDGYRIHAQGASLDLKPFLQKKPDAVAAPQDASPLIPFAIDFMGEFDWVVVDKERELHKVKARMLCQPELCENVSIRGMTGQNNAFAFTIESRENVRQLYFSARNAGSFLKAMNFYDGMQGGALHIYGKFDDEAEGRPFSGVLDISEHTITNAPVLAKMASLLSLSGIGDALQGKGITFQRISSDILYTKGVLRLVNGKAYGPALGVTVEDGVVNTNTRNLRATGTVVPSYTLNTALNNIPVIGQALSGGKGEGVFAASYKVEGAYPDAVDVTVNPLTMLAPGFLRNIFSGPDKAASDAVANPEPVGGNTVPQENYEVEGHVPPEVNAQQEDGVQPENSVQQEDSVQLQGNSEPPVSHSSIENTEREHNHAAPVMADTADGSATVVSAPVEAPME